jgi:hypothetical protein
MERETLVEKEVTEKKSVASVPKGSMVIGNDVTRTTYIGDYCCCHGSHFFTTGREHLIRKIHWKVCMNRCVMGGDYYETCESFMSLIEDQFAGVIPIVKAKLPKPKSAGYILDKHIK